MTSSSGGSDTRTKVTLKETGTTDTSDGLKPPPKQQTPNRSSLRANSTPKRSPAYHETTLEDLKYEVLSLKQKYEILQKEVARIRRDKINPTELLMIKSQITLDQSETSLIRISDYMNQLCETSRAVSALQLVCAGAERRIREELMRREELLKEHEQIESALVIDEVSVNGLHSWERQSDIQIVGEIEVLERRLDSLKRSIANERANTKAAQMNDVLGFVINAAEMEANLNIIGTDDIKEEIARMKEKKNATAEKVKNAKQEVADLRAKAKDLKSKPATGNVFDPGSELSELDREISSVRSDLERAQQSTLSLDQEILRLRLIPRPVSYEIPAPIEEPESSESSDDLDDFNPEMERSLRAQIGLLNGEIGELQQRYSNLKVSAAARQKQLKAKLKKLKVKLENNEMEIQRRRGLVEGEEEHQMGMLFDSINGKIEELKKGLSI